MGGAQLRAIIDRLRRAVGPSSGPGGAGDADLLARWLDGHDEAAFELLLHRHAPMVVAVCGRLLRRIQDVEDAAQATFLALARAGRFIGRREAVAGWLYRVAYRAALRIRADAARSSTFDPQSVELPAVAVEGNFISRDLRPVLDEEIRRLSRPLQEAFVLRYLQGRTNEQAAGELHCPVGTVQSRLNRARGRLRARLTRRGLAPSALGLATAGLSESTTAPASTAWFEVTVKAASLMAAGDTAGADAIAASSIALAREVTRTMWMTRLKIAAFVLLAVGIAGATAARAYQEPANKPAEEVAKAGPDQQAVPFKRMEISTVDLAEEMGLNIYKFRLDLPKGARYRLAVLELPTKDARARVLHNYDFEKVKDGPATLRVSFLRRDGRMQSVLLSDEKDAIYRVTCEECQPSGIVTIIENPLHTSPLTGRILYIARSEREEWVAKSGSDEPLLMIVQTKSTTPAADAGYPRAVLSLTRVSP